MTKPFKLQAGDYIDLRGMSVERKQKIQDFLREKGNKFWSDIQYESMIDYIVVDRCSKSLIRCTRLKFADEIRNNRTTELLLAMSPERPKGDAKKAYDFALGCLSLQDSPVFYQLLGDDSLDNYVFCEQARKDSDRKRKLKARLDELENEIASIKAELRE